MKRQFWVALTIAALLSTAGSYYAYRKWSAQNSSSRTELLAMMPADASAVLFVDSHELRTAPFFTKLLASTPKPQVDPEYAQFLKDTGFDYERDLDCIAIAIEKRGLDSIFFAVADGKFDRVKISALALKSGTALKTGSREIFSVAITDSRKISFTFLSGNRIALTNDAEPSNALSAKQSDAGQVEWHSHF